MSVKRWQKYFAPYVLVKDGERTTQHPNIKIGCIEIEAPEEQADSAYYRYLAKNKIERDLQVKHKTEIEEGYHIPPILGVYLKKEEVQNIIESKEEKRRLVEYWGKNPIEP
jgi:hypothetical protein